MKIVMLLVLVLSACTSGSQGEMPALPQEGFRATEAQGYSGKSPRADWDIGEGLEHSCAIAIPLAEEIDDGFVLSAFGRFNSQPPVPPIISPEVVAIPSAQKHMGDLRSCLPDGFPEFDVLDRGALVKGARGQVYPLGVFHAADELYLAAYLHKNYEMSGGEGGTVEISGVFLDSAGGVLSVEQELSSWYEYEGSIRVRDLSYHDGYFVKTEQVYDPGERDGSGHPLEYVGGAGRKIIKEYRIHLPEQ